MGAALVKGTDRRGTARVTEIDLADLSEFVQRAHRNGWKSLTATLDGDHVASIEPYPGKPGRRTWWALALPDDGEATR